MRHGRAIVPFGKYKGVRIRLIPDNYLSWLTSAKMMRDPRWKWLRDSLVSELKFRGMRYDLADTEDVPVPPDCSDDEKRVVEVFNKMSCFMR